jgi:ABC-2 type transport system permease protein
MASILALLRAAWLSATSYRVATLLSLAGVAATVVPVYFIAGAVQELAATSIQRESASYFAFIVVGIASVYIVSAATGALATAVSSTIGNGTLEALLVTRTGVPALLAGLAAHASVQAALRALVLLLTATLLGADIRWVMAPLAAAIAALTFAAYAGIGLVAAALVLLFRTSGPLITTVVGVSGLLGGAYYATTAVPGWLRQLTDFVPLTYGLRPARMLLLGNASLPEVTADVSLLVLMATASLLIGAAAFTLALRRARRDGTLSQY